VSREKPEPVLPQLPPPVAGTIGAMGERSSREVGVRKLKRNYVRIRGSKAFIVIDVAVYVVHIRVFGLAVWANSPIIIKKFD